MDNGYCFDNGTERAAAGSVRSQHCYYRKSEIYYLLVLSTEPEARQVMPILSQAY
jgi:hypothetical protein